MMRWEKKKVTSDKSTITKITRPDGSTIQSEEQPRTTIKNIGSLQELLQQIGNIPQWKFNEALKESQRTGKFIVEILEEKGIISHDSIMSLLIKQCKIPLVSLLSYSIDSKVVKMIPPEICDKYRILPIDKMGNTITLAMVNPLDAEAIKIAKQYCPNLQIRPILCSYKEFEKVKRRYLPSMEGTTTGQKVEENISTEQSISSQEEQIETIPEAVPVEPELLDPKTQEKIQQEQSFLHTVFTEPISVETSINKVNVEKEDFSLQDLAASMISSLQGSYELLIRKIKLFNTLTPEEVANIFVRCQQIHLNEGDVLFSKGDIGKSLYVLISGEIEVFDDEKQICCLSPGEMVGEMAVITQNKRSASVRAKEDSVLLEININDLYRFIPPIVAIKLLTNIIFTLSERLQTINEKLASKTK
ncbi:MAG TPA: cyclic nucleotide-binding domain-containing protein [Candidatus Hydrogenedens sp.]|nr:cyclic nucleotide-binding domain-containing protein [Candidatus Hydrogenedens sp.]HOL19396.1 cyclic nucleotide-binding domain-containing protein [Candidatus Hydrogenedens sp.]HPP58048.1 cyclic nucleotide-binding domain-containing protein [Candidatus Hydrogenedens sp.]